MKTILKFSLFVMALTCFNFVNAQPGDDPEGDPCPGWPNCDSVTVSEKAVEVNTVTNLKDEQGADFLKESSFPRQEELPELLQTRLKAVLDSKKA